MRAHLLSALPGDAATCRPWQGSPADTSSAAVPPLATANRLPRLSKARQPGVTLQAAAREAVPPERSRRVVSRYRELTKVTLGRKE